MDYVGAVELPGQSLNQWLSMTGQGGAWIHPSPSFKG